MAKSQNHHHQHRKHCDFTKLVVAGYDLELNNGNTRDFFVMFYGPEGTMYESGVWKVHVTLPEDYPFASPSIGFVNRIFHPNIDEASGTVCLDVINQTWTPIFSLVNVFDIFLPQLLSYPNAGDPLNAEAGNLMLTDKEGYETRVREYVRLYATREAVITAQQQSATGSDGKARASGSAVPVTALREQSTLCVAARNEKPRAQQPPTHSPLSDVSFAEDIEDDLTN